MVLYPAVLAFLVVPHVGVAAVTVHVAVRPRGTTVGKQYGDLVYRLRGERQEVPEHVRVLEVRRRVPLLGVDEVGELQRVADKENGGVVANHVVVALLSVELEGEPAWVSFRVRRAPLPADLGEAREHVGLLAHPGQEFRAGVLAYVAYHLEVPVCPGALGVHNPLRYPLAVKMGELFGEVGVLYQYRPVLTCGHREQVAVHRRSEVIAELFVITLRHGSYSFSGKSDSSLSQSSFSR